MLALGVLEVAARPLDDVPGATAGDVGGGPLAGLADHGGAGLVVGGAGAPRSQRARPVGPPLLARPHAVTHHGSVLLQRDLVGELQRHGHTHTQSL